MGTAARVMLAGSDLRHPMPAALISQPQGYKAVREHAWAKLTAVWQ